MILCLNDIQVIKDINIFELAYSVYIVTSNDVIFMFFVEIWLYNCFILIFCNIKQLMSS